MKDSCANWELGPPLIALNMTPIPLESIKDNSNFIIFSSDGYIVNRKKNEKITQYFTGLGKQYNKLNEDGKNYYLEKAISRLMKSDYKYFIQDKENKNICYDSNEDVECLRDILVRNMAPSKLLQKRTQLLRIGM